jgi:hypothetical protein
MVEPCVAFCFVVCSNCLFPIFLSLPQLGDHTDRNTCYVNKSPMLERMKEEAQLEDILPYLEACFQETEAIIVKCTTAMVGRKVLKALNAADAWKSSFNLASNLLNAGTSALANHVDAKCVLPAAMTCCNPMGATRPWFHGELLALHPRGFSCSLRLGGCCVDVWRQSSCCSSNCSWAGHKESSSFFRGSIFSLEGTLLAEEK